MLEDRQRKRGSDAGCAREILDSGAQHTLQAAELLQERAAAGRAETCNRFQHRGLPRPGTTAAVAADREPVRLIPHALDQV